MPVSVKQRRKIPRSRFVYPPGSRIGGKHGAYPLTSKKRARAALAYAGQKRTRGSYRTVAKKVRSLYPSIRTRGTSSRRSRRSGRR